MATSSSAQDRYALSVPPPAPPFVSNSVASRRLPPPCWSPDETGALIDTYRDKWYSLHRGNLRANHWQEVADDLALRCPVNPSKTSVQCRHKMEKLRKRYRNEIQRAAPYGGPPNHRYVSSWVHFKLMDNMERGDVVDAVPDEEDDQEDVKQNFRPIGDVYRNYSNRNMYQAPMSNGATRYTKYDEFGVQYPNPNPSCSSNFENFGNFGSRPKIRQRVSIDGRKKDDSIADLVDTIKGVGEGFVRIENMKMQMAREVEEMRMEMEMKRTQMILESQQQIVEAFAKAVSERRKTKKAKKMPTPDH